MLNSFLFFFFLPHTSFLPSLILGLPLFLLPVLVWPHTSLPLPSSFFSSCIAFPDHERKIELIRYLMSGYVNVHVLNTFSEHANVLASSAVAAFQDGADQLPPFLFLPVPSCQTERFPKRDG